MGISILSLRDQKEEEPEEEKKQAPAMATTHSRKKSLKKHGMNMQQISKENRYSKTP